MYPGGFPFFFRFGPVLATEYTIPDSEDALELGELVIPLPLSESSPRIPSKESMKAMFFHRHIIVLLGLTEARGSDPRELYSEAMSRETSDGRYSTYSTGRLRRSR